jgi:hypothetical protein
VAKRGRPAGFQMTEAHRTKIANSQILKCLLEHITGNREMSGTQVTAGIALLKKVLPDLSSTENTTEVIHRYVARLPEKVPDTQTWQQEHDTKTPTLQ